MRPTPAWGALMANDRTEETRRGHAPPKKSAKHPYAAIEHRVIDSPAFADLAFSARTLLLLLARQLTKDNNGHLQATHSYMRRFGFDAERTLARAIRELIAHGLIYRTRAGGYQKGAALYAVTWLSITRKQNVFLDGFKPCAWRDWKPTEKKSPPAKLPGTHGKNGILTDLPPAKNTVGSSRKNTEYELMPCSNTYRGHGQTDCCRQNGNVSCKHATA
jgi:hypothetical protein